MSKKSKANREAPLLCRNPAILGRALAAIEKFVEWIEQKAELNRLEKPGRDQLPPSGFQNVADAVSHLQQRFVEHKARTNIRDPSRFPLDENFHFEEIPSRKELVEKWERAYSRWKAILEDAYREKEENNWGGSAMPICNLAGQSCGEAGLPASPPLAGAQYNLYTDGACIVDTQLGGWAFVCDQLDREDVARHQSSGAASRTTNNRMELTAVVQGLESIPESARVEVVTDSLYVRKGMVNWLPAWKSQGWRAGSGRQLRSLCNADLWQRLDALLRHRQVTVRWVPGHAGHPENELCDRLAREAAEQLARQPGEGQPEAASV
jgi:ribonuclease HI